MTAGILADGESTPPSSNTTKENIEVKTMASIAQLATRISERLMIKESGFAESRQKTHA
jgi:hypothetical protein